MVTKTELLDILVCPQCKQNLAQVEGGQGLLCRKCQLKFPVRDGIPIMLTEEALDMRSVAPGGGEAAPMQPTVGGGTQVFQHCVTFKVVGGADEGITFDLTRGSCRALGRALEDATKTTVISVDWAISLDEETKGLILQYMAQQFRKPMTEESSKENRLGAFKREQDIVFKDNTLSRLHAMIFFDEVGIGILDLVSKNGTYVNGEEVESCLLKKGDTIELGETKIIFEG